MISVEDIGTLSSHADAHCSGDVVSEESATPEFDPQAHTQGLYDAKLKGLAQSKLAGKSAKQITEEINEIAREFKTGVRDVRSDFNRAVTVLGTEKTDTGTGTSDSQNYCYSFEGKQRAQLLFDCADKGDVYHRDFNAAGYKAELLQTLIGLLIYGSRFINARAWGEENNLICGSQFGITGSSAQGKSAFVGKVMKFIDCSAGDLQKRFERVSDCSEYYLAIAGGEDGKALADKVIWWDEIQSKGSTVYDKKIQIMGQTTTAGYYMHRSSTETATGGRKTIEYKLYGTLNHVFTTVDPPAAFDTQFRNRTIWLRLSKTESERRQIFKHKLSRSKPNNGKSLRAVYESWNYLSLLPGFKRLDPEDNQSFADVDMPFLQEVQDDTDRIVDEDLRRVDILTYMIAIHAIIYQKNRKQEVREDGRIVLIATRDDYNAVIEVFNNCVLGERTQVGNAEQQALLSVIPKMVEKGTMTIQELCLALDRRERTIWNYVKSWTDAGLVTEEKLNGFSHFKIGPALLDQSGLHDSTKLIECAEKIFSLVKGFRAEPLLSNKPVCNCSLHNHTT